MTTVSPLIKKNLLRVGTTPESGSKLEIEARNLGAKPEHHRLRVRKLRKQLPTSVFQSTLFERFAQILHNSAALLNESYGLHSLGRFRNIWRFSR